MPFKPGQSGNPKGRPKGSFSLKTKVVQYLEDHPDEMKDIVKSLAKDPHYRSLLFKMIDGVPKQQIELEHRAMPIPILPLKLPDKPKNEELNTGSVVKSPE